MSKWLLCAVAFVVGAGLRLAVRPATQDLEYEAVAAWNRGDAPRAETFARRALGRSPKATQARAVLSQVAAHDDRPLLHVAVLLSVPAGSPEAADARFQAGDVALDHGYAAIAALAWHDAVRLAPDHEPSHSRLITLAGLRLDRERIINLLIERAKHCSPTAESLQLLVGAEFLNFEPAAREESLRTFVANDATDGASLVGLCRCLLALHRDVEARHILRAAPPSFDRNLLLVQAELAAGNLEAATAVFAEISEHPESGDYWHVAGEVALASGNHGEAVRAFALAVEHRPLNREIRARYCHALRLNGDHIANDEQAQALNDVQQIEETVTSPSMSWTASTIEELIRRCTAVGAVRVAGQLRDFRDRRLIGADGRGA